MSEITKGHVLEVFMKHLGRKEDPDERRRVLEAYNDVLDEIAPWRRGMTAEEKARAAKVAAYLAEILLDDFGIEMRLGKKFTPVEIEGCNAGGAAAIEWLKSNADRIPPRPETEEAARAWMKTVHGWAFELVPSGRAADKEWTHGFIAAFAGDLWRHIQGQPPIGSDHKVEPD